ncbi:hypothetical protein N7471_013704 [Penicillium samsonianum]|uniref:uncharacterized protein n=1 Tax=Penicillium samsonianum TaxID=1882272 RepID=UPI00254814C6|nr:uncharacterized protein N7471_013704 [Penicillium samsonianum]KAJ6118237.1 hypothetical protein N7471_013704 [Penicillium samsonianum]
MEPRPRRRRRIARSCTECRRRKIRCDRKDPCTHCVATQLRCTYKGYGDQPAPLLEATEEISDLSVLTPSSSRLVQQVGGGRSASGHDALPSPLGPAIRAPTPAGTTTQIDPSIPQYRNERQSSVCGQNFHADLADLLNRVQALERSSVHKPADGLSETNQAILERPSRIESSEWIFSKTRIMRWSLWMGTAKEVLVHLSFRLEASR